MSIYEFFHHVSAHYVKVNHHSIESESAWWLVFVLAAFALHVRLVLLFAAGLAAAVLLTT